MEKSSKRGKIPQADWPQIMARYEAGETLASIARTYDCSAPAISYIVSRSREKPAVEILPPPTEPQLIKAQPSDSPVRADEPKVAPAPAEPPAAEMRREAMAAAARETGEPGTANLFQRNGSNGSAALAAAAPRQAAGAAAGNGESRPRLHLSLGNGNGHGAALGNGHSGGHANGERPAYPEPARPPHDRAADEARATRPLQAAARPADERNGRDLFAAAEGRPQAQMPRDNGGAGRRGDNGAFIDQELRIRVDGDIAAFLAAFDAALAADTHESRFGLREATDRLLRAGARTRIELERLEARVPLTPRDSGQVDPGAWRHR